MNEPGGIVNQVQIQSEFVPRRDICNERGNPPHREAEHLVRGVVGRGLQDRKRAS